MKIFFKILKLSKTLLVCSIFIFIISCNEVDKPIIENNEAKKEMLKHIIPLDEAFDMYDTYSKKRNNILKDTLQRLYGENFHDSRTVWFDVETLKEYIKYVENQSADLGTTPQGFKICFGVYSDDEKLGDEANHQNVFLIPTTENGGRQSAYTIRNGKIVFLKDVRVNSSKAGFMSSIITLDEDEEGLILNRGSTQPPPGSGDSDFE